MTKTIDFDEILSLEPVLEDKAEGLRHPIILYGAGVGGEYYIRLLQKNYGIRPAAVCDTYKVGQLILGHAIVGLEDVLDKYKEPRIIITSITYYREIKEKLLAYFPEDAFLALTETTPAMLNNFKTYVRQNREGLDWLYRNLADEKSRETLLGVLKGKITGDPRWASRLYESDQYFVPGVVNLSDDECFIDGGAYVGDTVEIFMRKTGGRFDKIYCFEPSVNNFEKLAQTKGKYNDDERIALFRAGLYSQNSQLGFVDDELSPSNMIDRQYEAINKIDVVAIDSVINGRVTLIKMDIEGAELEALKGARQTILTQRPRLVICVYHKDEDILDIPRYIMDLGLGYTCYLRHHNADNYNETVFYAV